MERKRETFRSKLVRGVLSIVLLRLAVLMMILAPLLPRGASSTTTRQTVHDGIVVVCDINTYRFGFPLSCAEVRRQRVSAVQEGSTVEVTREIIDAYCEVQMSRDDPRALRLVMSWWRFVANAATFIGLLVAGLIAREKWLGHRANERALHGRCRSCGYDLRSTASGVCPACDSQRIRRHAVNELFPFSFAGANSPGADADHQL